jgi:hypothetical protein
MEYPFLVPLALLRSFMTELELLGIGHKTSSENNDNKNFFLRTFCGFESRVPIG